MKKCGILMIIFICLLCSSCESRTEIASSMPIQITSSQPELLPPSQISEPSSQSSELSSQSSESSIPTPPWQVVLVNRDNPIPLDYDIKLATFSGPYRVDERILENVNAMFDAAKADGIDLMVCSAYRSVESQTRIFQDKVDEHIRQGKTVQAATIAAGEYIAPPNSSEHHTGLALDIVTPTYQMLNSGFEDTDAFAWLAKNAVTYGFILRYPKDKVDSTKISYEPWHYRYVGEQLAAKIKDSGLCLEEYLSDSTLS